MNPWVVILLITAGIVFGLDYLVRRKKWKDNTRLEKISLVVNMVSVSPYMLLSAFGILWGIVPGSPETAFGEILYNVTLNMGSYFFVVAAAAVILTFVLRKMAKVKASIWVNVIAFAYIVLALIANNIAGKLL